uniref:UBA domain-containing protein n=1 Tax=viral metagenome TaxID=1070528 RepID=A0A6C0B383_9ZZZZ
MSHEIFVKNLVNDIINNIINTAKNNIINKSFYLIKYSSINNSYVSSEVLYKNIINNDNIGNCRISDVLESTSKNLKTILPIPILNGKYLSENLLINYLPSKLIVIFVNMNIIEKSAYPISINNSTALNYIMNMITGSIDPLNPTSLLLPPPPEINDTAEETFINERLDKYKDEINILKNMGFNDENKIIESLIVSDGNINNAIHYYLQ